MDGKRVKNFGKIRAYIKVRTKLGHSVKQIFTKLCMCVCEGGGGGGVGGGGRNFILV